MTNINNNTFTSREAHTLAWILLLLSLPAILSSTTVPSTVALHLLSNTSIAYFQTEHIWQVYVWSPIVILSACILLYAPGLFLTLSLNGAPSIGQWLVYSLGISIITISSLTEITEAIIGTPLLRGTFILSLVFFSFVCYVYLIFKLKSGYSIISPFSQKSWRVTIYTILLVPFFLLIVLAPKFYWETFNGDGAHAYETSRLLLKQALPFWPSDYGAISHFPGITSSLFAFPSSWFIRIFGELEVSARIPYIMFIIALFGAVLALVNLRREKSATLVEMIYIWLGLGIYTIVMAFSATYNPYFADIALPATQDTLQIACFLGFTIAYLQAHKRWLFFFAVLTYLTSPNGLFLILLWFMAAFLAIRPMSKDMLKITFLTIVIVIATTTAIKIILRMYSIPEPGDEYAVTGMLNRFALIQINDWQRFLYMVIPTGFIPALAILAWRWQDSISRTFTLVTLAYFFFIYFQAYVSLHYFVPAMILPLIVFWRIKYLYESKFRIFLLGLTCLGGVAGLFLSLPPQLTIQNDYRIIGRTILLNTGNYEAMDSTVFRSSVILDKIFPGANVPDKGFGGSPIAWIYYAKHNTKPGAEINYLVQNSDSGTPGNMSLFAEEDGIRIYMRDNTIWEKHLAVRPPTPAGSPYYYIPRSMLFQQGTFSKRPYLTDVAKLRKHKQSNSKPKNDKPGDK